MRLRLPEQPFRVLVALLERPQDLVTREELHKRVWPEDTFVDFEQGLNRAVNKVREALGDSAGNPRFIETLPGRGYRFIGSVVNPELELEAPPAPTKPRRLPAPAVWTVLALLVTILISFWLFRREPVGLLTSTRLTADNFAKYPPVLTDGARVYFRASFAGETFLALAPANGGPSTRIPLTPPSPIFQLQDITPDGQDLLLTVSETAGAAPSLWSLRLGDGGSRKLVNAPVSAATYAPDGERIVLTSGNRLSVCRADGSDLRAILEVRQARIGMLSWSPDGRTIRYEQEDVTTRTSTAWELRLGGVPRQLVTGWPEPRLAPLGWALGGRLGLFESGGLWWGRLESTGLLPRAPGMPERLTSGEPEFTGPIRARAGSPFFAIGEDRLGELQRLDTRTMHTASMLDGASAEGVRYSPDGRQLLYLSYPQGQLWVRRADGTRPVQLTSPPLVVSYAQWSPDGSRIAFVGHANRRGAGSIYVIDALGGAPQRLRTAEDASFGDPTWLPDGRLVFGLLGASGRRELAYLHVADLRKGSVSRLPGSEGLFSPRCCSTGGELAALQWRSDAGPREIVVFNWKEGQRVSQLTGVRARFPEWAPDGGWLAFLEDDRLMRWQPGQPAAQQWLDVPIGEFGGFYRSFTFAPDGNLLHAVNRDRQQVYSLQIPALLR